MPGTEPTVPGATTRQELTTAMDSHTLLTWVGVDGALLGATSPDALGLVVPTCPAWTVAELVGHTGWVHRWVTATLLAGPDNPPSPKSIDKAPTDESVLAWYVESLGGLLDAFGRTDLDQVFKTFIGPRPGQWWVRRMAHETSVHRWDAQNAVGATTPIDAALAVDGVDEALDTYVTHRFDAERFGSAGQTLHLHATDAEGEWMLTMQPGGVETTHGHGKGDAAVRGRAEDLLLFVMGRRAATDLEIFGDNELPARWQAAANF